MTSTETPVIDIGRNFGFAISEGPLTTVSTESGVEILPVTKVFFSGIGNSSSSSNVSVLTSVVKWSVGSVSALAVLMNMLVMIMIHKGKLLKKDHRLIYYVFMSVGAMCFATSTATNSLSILISETNLFPVYGTCLMVQATAMGSFHMIGLSIVLLTLELYNHVASSLGNLSAKITGDIIKCGGCYTLGILVCYFPFSFWTEHPQEVAICSIPAIYGKHVHAANYLGIFTFCAITTLLLIANSVLLKATRSTDWRTKLRIHTDITSSQIRGSVSSQESSPAERTEPTILTTTTDIQQTDTALKETRFPEKPGPSNEPSMREDCSPTLSPTLALPHRPSSVSTETQATTLDEGSKDSKETQPNLTVEDCKDIPKEPAEERENGNTQSSLLEEPSVCTDVFEALDTFFVSGQPAECTTLDSSRTKSRTLRDSVVLSVMKLPAARENMAQENIAGKEEVIKVETALSKGIRLSSRQGSSLTKSNGNSCCFSIISCGGRTARTNPSGRGRSIEADSISSTESIKKRHLKNREMELRKFLKAVRTEITFALVYVFCTLPSLIWNIKNLYCSVPCLSEETAFMDYYYVGMAILPFINPIILLFTLK